MRSYKLLIINFSNFRGSLNLKAINLSSKNVQTIFDN